MSDDLSSESNISLSKMEHRSLDFKLLLDEVKSGQQVSRLKPMDDSTLQYIFQLEKKSSFFKPNFEAISAFDRITFSGYHPSCGSK